MTAMGGYRTLDESRERAMNPANAVSATAKNKTGIISPSLRSQRCAWLADAHISVDLKTMLVCEGLHGPSCKPHHWVAKLWNKN